MQAPLVAVTSAIVAFVWLGGAQPPAVSRRTKMPFGTRLDHWLQLIRGEFQEVPDLRVTLEQAAVLWKLEPRDLELILDTFVDVGFLRRSPAGSYFQPQPGGVTTDTARSNPGVDRRQQGMAPDPGIPRG